jgi:hypothetical protein
MSLICFRKGDYMVYNFKIVILVVFMLLLLS